MLLKRPLFHHTPPDGWMNDPIGLLRHDGVWRLHYQRAVDPEQRAMGWGAAVSENLLSWRARSDAMSPSGTEWIYSGSVLDEANAAGAPFAAFYTRHDPMTGEQRQELALSDDGAVWRRWSGNPVIEEHRGETRDPFVFRYEDEWRLVIAEPVAWARPHEGRSRIAIYASDDLIHWRRLGEMGIEGEPCVMFETPLLRRLAVEEEPSSNWPWLLLAGVIDRAGDGARCGTHAWLGEFDGSKFTSASGPLALDHGPDFYAAAGWAGTGDDLIVTAWVNSWAYARLLPGDGWIGGAHSLPRRLTGRRLSDGSIKIVQRPVAVPSGRALQAEKSAMLCPGSLLVEARAPFLLELNKRTPIEARIELMDAMLTLTRNHSDAVLEKSGFAGRWTASLRDDASPPRLTLLLDGCVLALFVEGDVAMTALVDRAAEDSVTVEGAILRIEALDG